VLGEARQFGVHRIVRVRGYHLQAKRYVTRNSKL
jgi:hypothetical protein